MSASFIHAWRCALIRAHKLCPPPQFSTGDADVSCCRLKHDKRHELGTLSCLRQLRPIMCSIPTACFWAVHQQHGLGGCVYDISCHFLLLRFMRLSCKCWAASAGCCTFFYSVDLFIVLARFAIASSST